MYSWYIHPMATTIHLPPDLLERVDLCARRGKLSRNRYIRQALERTTQEQIDWSADFLAQLDSFTPLKGGEELLEIIRCHRRSKSPPRF
jgi:predicted DNA-binding protein